MSQKPGITFSQLRHAQSMSKKIRTQLDSMLASMRAIDFIAPNTMQDIPVQSVINKFEELEAYWNRIQSILTDMLPELEQQDTTD